MTERELMQAAQDARKNSYSPYSHFCVGAALVTKSGKLYTGCNIENAAYPATVCAERTALFKAVSEGERAFQMLAVVGGKEGETAEFCSPCGVCRQALAEFCPPDFPVLLGTPAHFEKYTLGELLPHSFTSENF